MNQKEWMTVPVLFAASLDETLDFWEALGYEKTYYQKSPYGYAVMSCGEYGLHFIQQKWLKPEDSYGCLVMVTDVEAVHQNFSRALKGKLGSVPNKVCHASRASDQAGNALHRLTLQGIG